MGRRRLVVLAGAEATVQAIAAAFAARGVTGY
jgi:hypothetical protein